MQAANTTSYKNVGIVITCEHGGNQIPELYHDLFKDRQALLYTHRGFDFGALMMARELADAFSAPLVSSHISRLLVDLNRSVGHPNLHADWVAHRATDLRESILQHYYHPYRGQVEQLVRQAIAEQGQVIHLSSHSFTPELNGVRRTADVGLLYDPARSGELGFCKHWQWALKACAPELVVRRNYPYLGKNDGLTAWFRQRLPASAYIGIELEINQHYVISGGQQWHDLRKAIIESLQNVLISQSW
ncbi:N-formylglutamate amidohydrolase [Methylosoma difficile]